MQQPLLAALDQVQREIGELRDCISVAEEDVGRSAIVAEGVWAWMQVFQAELRTLLSANMEVVDRTFIDVAVRGLRITENLHQH